MNEIIILFLSLVITISLLHLLSSAIIMTKKMNSSLNEKGSEAKDEYPVISILKPLKGIDDQLEKNLRSFFNLDYPNYEILFRVDSYQDPAVKIVNVLQKE